MKLTGAEIIIKTLIEQGVTDVFGYPGGQVINIYDSLYKYQDENRHKYSIKDTRSLGSLISYFEKEVMYYQGVADLTPKQIENGDYKKILEVERKAIEVL